MAVILETSLGDITVDLYIDERPKCSENFLKLCKIKYYNWCLFHSVQRNLVAQSGDPSGTGRGGESIYAKLYGDQAKCFDAEVKPRIKHKKKGTVSMVNNGSNMHGSQFFITLAPDIDYLDGDHTVFGEVAEGFEILDKINEVYVDQESRPYQDIRIYHTVVLDDPFDDADGLAEYIAPNSPQLSQEQLESDRIGAEEEIDKTKGKTEEEINEELSAKEAKANAQLLEMVGDLPDVDVNPEDNVLFVCKLNPVTTGEDLGIIFSRFGNILSCEVIKDQKTGESLQYAFIEFETSEQCENAYFKMDNVLIDERRIHVDFSQSVAKLKHKGQRGSGVDIRNQYMIKDNKRPIDGYQLVFSDNESEKESYGGKRHKKNKKSKYRDNDEPRSYNDSRHKRDQYRDTRKRSVSRSPIRRNKRSPIQSQRKRHSPSPGHHRRKSPSPVYRRKSSPYRGRKSPIPSHRRSPSPGKKRKHREASPHYRRSVSPKYNHRGKDDDNDYDQRGKKHTQNRRKERSMSRERVYSHGKKHKKDKRR